MRTSWIMSLAAACGVGAFVYTLAAGTRRGREVQLTGGGPAVMSTRQASPLPASIEDKEQMIEQNTRNGRAPSGRIHFALAEQYADAERVEDAKKMWDEAAKLRLAGARRNPDDPDLWFEAGWSLWRLDRMSEAREPLLEAEKRYSAIPPDQKTDPMWYRLGWTRKLLGMDQDAVIAWSRARDMVARLGPMYDNGVSLYNLACYRALLGEKEAALSALEKAVQAGWTDAARAMHDEDLVPLRDEARFMDAVRKMQGQPVRIEIGPG